MIKTLGIDGERVNDSMEITCLADEEAIAETLERVEDLKERLDAFISELATEANAGGYTYEELSSAAGALEDISQDYLRVAIQQLESALEQPWVRD